MATKGITEKGISSRGISTKGRPEKTPETDRKKWKLFRKKAESFKFPSQEIDNVIPMISFIMLANH